MSANKTSKDKRDYAPRLKTRAGAATGALDVRQWKSANLP